MDKLLPEAITCPLCGEVVVIVIDWIPPGSAITDMSSYVETTMDLSDPIDRCPERGATLGCTWIDLMRPYVRDKQNPRGGK